MGGRTAQGRPCSPRARKAVVCDCVSGRSQPWPAGTTSDSSVGNSAVWATFTAAGGAGLRERMPAGSGLRSGLSPTVIARTKGGRGTDSSSDDVRPPEPRPCRVRSGEDAVDHGEDERGRRGEILEGAPQSLRLVGLRIHDVISTISVAYKAKNPNPTERGRKRTMKGHNQIQDAEGPELVHEQTAQVNGKQGQYRGAQILVHGRRGRFGHPFPQHSGRSEEAPRDGKEEHQIGADAGSPKESPRAHSSSVRVGASEVRGRTSLPLPVGWP